jgi:hypothetical protein
LVFVGGTQTPSPLIRPAGSILGGAVRGRKQNQDSDDCTACIYTLFVPYYFGGYRLPINVFSYLAGRSLPRLWIIELLGQSRYLIDESQLLRRPWRDNNPWSLAALIRLGHRG